MSDLAFQLLLLLCSLALLGGMTAGVFVLPRLRELVEVEPVRAESDRGTLGRSSWAGRPMVSAAGSAYAGARCAPRSGWSRRSSGWC